MDTGLFSEWLVDRLAPGDEIEVAPPSGSFTPDLTAPAHHGLIAAGRSAIAASTEQIVYKPRHSGEWEAAFGRLTELVEHLA